MGSSRLSSVPQERFRHYLAATERAMLPLEATANIAGPHLLRKRLITSNMHYRQIVSSETVNLILIVASHSIVMTGGRFPDLQSL